MSLDKLIDIVCERFKVTKFRAAECIYNVIINTGDKFNEVNYQEIKGALDSNQLIVLDEMINQGVIQKKVLCECMTESTNELIDEEVEECPICKMSIRDNNHEVTDYYNLEIKLKQRVESLLETFADEEYIADFTKPNFHTLIEKKDYLIPFIGSGLSIPLDFPSWGKMIKNLENNLEQELVPAFNRYVTKGDYLKALSYLEENTLLDTEQIKEKIVQEFDKVPRDILYKIDNNYIDLFRLNSKFYITTNYDNLLTEYISKQEATVTLPHTWKDIIDMQNLQRENKKRVFHIHGHIQKTDTMIVTQEDYDALYSKTSIKNNLLTIMGASNLMFIGFSFNDEFFKVLYKDITSSIKGSHFIILPNISLDKAKEIMADAPGLRIIGLNIKTDNQGWYDKQDFVQGVRTVLRHLVN